MTNKIEISRELAERLARRYPAEITDQETMQAMRIEALAALDELRALLAAPAVERQEPVALQHMAVAEDGELRWMTGRKMLDCELYAMPDGSAIRLPLYTSPPAPVAVVLPERKSRTTGYWYDLDLNDKIDDTFARGWNACLDKVKEMNK